MVPAAGASRWGGRAARSRAEKKRAPNRSPGRVVVRRRLHRRGGRHLSLEPVERLVLVPQVAQVRFDPDRAARYALGELVGGVLAAVLVDILAEPAVQRREFSR